MKTHEKLSTTAVRERDPLTNSEKHLTAKALTHLLYDQLQGRRVELDTVRAMGAKDSAHDVFFVKATERDKAGHRDVFACKRFRRLDSAQHEVQGMIEGHNRGFVTPKVVGQTIFPVEDIGFVVVTENIPRFTTMNHLGWRDLYVGEPDYERKLAKPLRDVAHFTAEMHSAGITHGDMQVKNVGRNMMGQFVLFDTEDTQFVSQQDLNDIDFISRAGDDLRVLATSLVTRGYLWNSTDEIFDAEMHRNLLDPYVEAIIENNTIHEPLLIDYAQHGLSEAMAMRPLLHTDFANRMGLPS